MNRRNFFKSVGITLVGILFISKTKGISKCSWWGAIECSGQKGNLCSRCKYTQDVNIPKTRENRWKMTI